MGGDSRKTPITAKYLAAVEEPAAASKSKVEQSVLARKLETKGQRIADADEIGELRTRREMDALFNKSKWMAKLLRHGAVQQGVSIRADGFVPIDEVIEEYSKSTGRKDTMTLQNLYDLV